MKRLAQTVAGLAAGLVGFGAGAHSASDAYLTLTAQPKASAGATPAGATVLHGQWDVALRDLDFVLTLDDNGDGNVTWAELRRHQAGIARYALAQLHFSADGKPCQIKPIRQLVDNHADGAYAALFFDVACGGVPSRITLDYGLFFAIDPSHRAITVIHSGADTATAVLSPENAKIDLTLPAGRAVAAPASNP